MLLRKNVKRTRNTTPTPLTHDNNVSGNKSNLFDTDGILVHLVHGVLAPARAMMAANTDVFLSYILGILS